MNGNNINSNKMDISDKVNHRTHHTRFFEKLYGNLEKSSDENKEAVNLSHQNQSLSLGTEFGRQETLNSPSESSGSSSEIYTTDLNGSRCVLSVRKSFFNELSVSFAFDD